MPALIDLRRRIKSVRNTQKITRAMKSVATAKFKQAQRKVLETRPHWHGWPELAARIAAAASGSPHPLLEKRAEKIVRMVVIASDKGLAGAFSSNVLEAAVRFLEEKPAGTSVRLILMGKKAVLFFRRLKYQIDRQYMENVQTLTQEDLEDLADSLMREYTLKRSDSVYVAYNEFKSILAPRVTIMRLLPLEPPAPDEIPGIAPDWEPGQEGMLRTLLPRFVRDQIRHCFHESLAAEQAARMMAMDNATNNAEDLIEDLTLVLNKIRQAAITTELLEIQSAVNAQAENR
jgi:F-type H+-transporting ATPase subunit gamma